MPVSTPERTITCPSRFRWKSWSPASMPSCGARRARPGRRSPSGPLALDARLMRVSVDGARVDLSPLEYRALAYLVYNAGRVVSAIELGEHVYGSGPRTRRQHARSPCSAGCAASSGPGRSKPDAATAISSVTRRNDLAVAEIAVVRSPPRFALQAPWPSTGYCWRRFSNGMYRSGSSVSWEAHLKSADDAFGDFRQRRSHGCRNARRPSFRPPLWRALLAGQYQSGTPCPRPARSGIRRWPFRPARRRPARSRPTATSTPMSADCWSPRAWCW